MLLYHYQAPGECKCNLMCNMIAMNESDAQYTVQVTYWPGTAPYKSIKLRYRAQDMSLSMA